MTSNLKVDYLILGGGVAGTTAAETIRERSDGSVMIVTDDANCLYSRVRLPDYIAGSIPREKVFIKEEKWYRDQRIDLLRETPVVSLSPRDCSVGLKNGKKIRYGKLLLATGGVARRPRFGEPEKEGIYSFRTIEDAERIREALGTSKNAVVLGGGYIGLELVRCSIRYGLETVLVLMDSQFWPQSLDEASSKMVERVLREKGVIVHFQSQIQTIMGNGKIQGITLDPKRRYDCNFLGIGIGISTLHPFIETSGIEVKNGVLTDETLKTTDSNIYAAGDVAEFYDVKYQKHRQLGNWVNAIEQGKIAGANMAGDRQVYRAISNYAIRIFGLSIGFVGETANVSGTDIIRRGSPEDEGYVRLFIRNGRIKGATLINRSHEMRPIMQLIQKEVPVNPKESNLENIDYELDSFL